MGRRIIGHVVVVTVLVGGAVPRECMGQIARHVVQHADDVVRVFGDDALRLLPLVFGLVTKLAGLVAVFGAAMYVREKRTEEAAGYAAVVSFLGGVWLAYDCFGWPFVASVQEETGFLGLPGRQVATSSFSVLRLIGNLLAGIGGIAACNKLSQVELKDK